MEAVGVVSQHAWTHRNAVIFSRIMDTKKPDSWGDSKGLARAILYDRAERRKWLGWMVMIPLGMLAVGLWVLDKWIWESAWRVLFWWGGCAAMTFFVIVFALYDAMAVIREERQKEK